MTTVNPNRDPAVFVDAIEARQQTQNSDFTKQQMDIGYSEAADSYWTKRQAGVGDGVSWQEAINFASQYQMHQADFSKFFGYVPPWQLTNEQLDDPQIQSLLELMDEQILNLKNVISAKFPDLKPEDADYQKKLAIGLFVFCMYPLSQEFQNNQPQTLSPEEEKAKFNQKQNITAFLEELLHQEELAAYSEYLNNFGGLGIYAIEEDTTSEGTVFDVLINRLGLCTEQSYTYRFVAERAGGLDVGFSVASVTSYNTADHVHNIVYLNDGTLLKIDLAQIAVDKNYSRSLPIDLHQVYARYLENKLASKTYDSIEDEIADCEMIFDLVPTDAENTIYLAKLYLDLSELNPNKKTTCQNRAQELLYLAKKWGQDNNEVDFNIASMLTRYPEFGEARPYYERYRLVLSPWLASALKSETIDPDNYEIYTRQAVRLAHAALALEDYTTGLAEMEKAIEMGSEMEFEFQRSYAFALKRNTKPYDQVFSDQFKQNLYNNVIVSLYNSQNFYELIFVLKRACERWPNDTKLKALYKETLILLCEESLVKDPGYFGIVAGQKFIEDFPDDDQGYFYLGAFCLYYGDAQKAVFYFEKALAINPSSKVHQTNLEKARRERKTQNANGGSINLAHFDNMDFNAAKNEISIAFLAEDDAQVILLFEALDSDYQTNSYLRKLYNIAVFNTAVDHSNSQNHDAALKLAKKLEEVFPKDPKVMALLATVYFNIETFDQAAIYFDKAFKLDPQNETHKQNADICRKRHANVVGR